MSGRLLLQGVSVVTGFGVLGYVIGIFIGKSGAAPEVLAATIPAVLTLAGGFILFKSEDTHYVMGSLSVIVLSVSILFSASHGQNIRYAEQLETQQIVLDTKKARAMERALDLITCSKIEREINNYRKDVLNLLPLSHKVFCR